jgi:fibronectin type 3 domain-containing protein
VDFQNPTNARIAGGEVTYTDKNVSAGNVYMYWIGAYNLKGREGRTSDEIAVVFNELPQPPRDLRASADPKGVVLEWDPPPKAEDIRSYRVYRGASDNPEEMKPVGGTGSGGTTYMDREAEKDKPYFYTVRSVRITRGVFLESGPSAMARAVLPAVQWHPPERVIVESTPRGMSVFWDKIIIENQETRYNIYRQETGRMPEKLNAEGLTNPSYLDSRVVKGRKYRYAVTAFPKGKPGDESGRSASEEKKFVP